MSNAVVESIIINPGEKPLTLKLDKTNRAFQQSENFPDINRTFDGGLAAGGDDLRYDWSATLWAPRATYDDLTALFRRLRANPNVAPYGETTLYNFLQYFQEENVTERSRRIVPSAETPNPHLVYEQDNGDGTFNFGYYVTQQIVFNVTPTRETRNAVGFRFDCYESRIMLSSEE